MQASVKEGKRVTESFFICAECIATQSSWESSVLLSRGSCCCFVVAVFVTSRFVTGEGSAPPAGWSEKVNAHES